MKYDKHAFQDQMPYNHCYGCGPENDLGLQIKSYWSAEDESVCVYTPQAHQCAGPQQYVNGGVIATVIDCHSICTAMAKVYAMAGREIGEGKQIWFATGRLELSYFKPTPIDRELMVIAKITEAKEKKITLECSLSSGGEVCVEANVIAVRVPSDWF